MISDTLLDAAAEVKDYLESPTFKDCYSDPELRKKLEEFIEKMKAMGLKAGAMPPQEGH